MEQSWRRAVNLWSANQRAADGYWESGARGIAKLMVYSAVPQQLAKEYLTSVLGDGVGFNRIYGAWETAICTLIFGHESTRQSDDDQVVADMLNEYFEEGDHALCEVAFDYLEEKGLHDQAWLNPILQIRPNHECDLDDLADFACDYLITHRQIPIPTWIDKVAMGLTDHGQAILSDLCDTVITRAAIVFVRYYNKHMELKGQYILDMNEDTITYITAEDMFRPLKMVLPPMPGWNVFDYVFIGARGDAERPNGRFHSTAEVDTFAIFKCKGPLTGKLDDLPVVLNPFKML